MSDLPKKTITLFELEEQFAAAYRSATGKNRQPQYPPELAPGYERYCRRSWGAWDMQKFLLHTPKASLQSYDLADQSFKVALA